MLTTVDTIDAKLDDAFTQKRIIEFFYRYVAAKWDIFSGQNKPDIRVPLGADGIDHKAFGKEVHRNARNISERVRAGTYTFYPFRELDKPKDASQPLSPKNKRTLGIASIRDALVQTILYNDVLHEETESVFSTLDKPDPVSFAYRKGKSAPLAAKLVHSYLKDGYNYIYDADLSKFFDTINHDLLLKKVAELLGGSSTRTYQLIRRFMRTDRVPHSTYRRSGWKPPHKIFHIRKPIRRTPKLADGVPQGGVLSGMLANLYLHDFDKWIVKELGTEIDLKYVRYADDFIVMVKTQEALDKLSDIVCQKLESSEFQLRINKDKSKSKHISETLDFIGFNFDGTHIRIRESSVNKFKARITKQIFDSVPTRVLQYNSYFRTLKWLIYRINAKVRGGRGKTRCPWCQYERIGPPRSWIKFFQSITDINQIRGIDEWIRKSIYDYIFKKYRVRCERKWLRRNRGLRSLVNELHEVRRSRVQPCLCDIKKRDHNIWLFACAIYQGKTFRTLAKAQPFTVPMVDNMGLQISVRGNVPTSIKGRQYRIKRDEIQQLWNRLWAGEVISRASLEAAGVSNTSYLVALLAQLPGVQVSLNPIVLSFKEKPPAAFLIPPPVS